MDFAPGYCTWYAASLSPWMYDADGARLLEEMLRIGMQMHKVQLQKLQELKLLELLQK